MGQDWRVLQALQVVTKRQILPSEGGQNTINMLQGGAAERKAQKTLLSLFLASEDNIHRLFMCSAEGRT